MTRSHYDLVFAKPNLLFSCASPHRAACTLLLLFYSSPLNVCFRVSQNTILLPPHPSGSHCRPLSRRCSPPSSAAPSSPGEQKESSAGLGSILRDLTCATCNFFALSQVAWRVFFPRQYLNLSILPFCARDLLSRHLG